MDVYACDVNFLTNKTISMAFPSEIGIVIFSKKNLLKKAYEPGIRTMNKAWLSILL